MDAAQTPNTLGRLGRHRPVRTGPGSDVFATEQKFGARVHLRAGLEGLLELKVALVGGLLLLIEL